MHVFSGYLFLQMQECIDSFVATFLGIFVYSVRSFLVIL